MSVGKSTRSKAQAAVSEAQADVKRLEAQLSSDEARLKRAEAGDSMVDTVTNVPLVKESTAFLRQRSEANVADARAKVDRTTSELITAENGLKWAQRGLNAVDNVAGVVSELIELPEVETLAPTQGTPPQDSTVADPSQTEQN